MLTAERLGAAQSAAVVAASDMVDLAAQVARVPAPTGEEQARAAFVAERFRDVGLSVTMDPLFDVVATVPGAGNGPPLLLAAHLDTVFPRATPLNIRRAADRLHGPGVGDNSLAVAALLSLPALLKAMNERPAVDLLLATNVGEEGLGNLRGMRAVMDEHPAVGAVVAVEGHNLGRITHIAVGSRRLRVTVRGPGGHSWGDYGKPSAIHVVAGVVNDLAALPLPEQPKTSLNVGLIEGGISVNTIAPTASFVIDLRSVGEDALQRLVTEVEQRVLAVRDGELDVQIEILGDRPAGEVPVQSPIVEVAIEILTALGMAVECDASSTDANIPISRGVPAICVGLTSGGNVHREDEYIDIPPVGTGMAQLALLALQLADHLGTEAPKAHP